MIRVVVADDEIKVCQLICGLIDWKSVDMEIVGVAHNGIDAVEMIKTLHPDLVITDIRMPGYDGLEMISHGKQINKYIDFIIISGYSHFQYAQSAVKYGVSDYLLKPIKKDELLDALNKIRERYMQRTEQLSSEEQLKIRQQSDIDKLRSDFFTEILLKKGTNQDDIGINQINEEYHYKFQTGCFQVFIVKIDCEYEDIYKSSIRIMEDKVIQILRTLLKQECFDMETCFKDSRAYCILNYGANYKKAVRKQLKACLDELLVQMSIFDKLEFTIGLGTVVDDINQLKSSLKAAEWAVEQRLIEGTKKLIEDVPVQDSFPDKEVLMASLTNDMESAIDGLDPNGITESIDRLKEQLLKISNISGQEMFRLAMDICSIYLMLLRKHQLNIENPELFYESFSLHSDLCSSVSKLFEYMSMVIGQSVDAAIEDRKQADIKPIRTAKKYIQQNYMNPISLKEVSSIVGFNDTYFSSLFKKESGKNFLEYLSEVRMNKAKEFLKETNLNIAVICEKVGYSDLKHFVKSFKKCTGLKPNEYRKLYS